jgi:hypothetical protein
VWDADLLQDLAELVQLVSPTAAAFFGSAFSEYSLDTDQDRMGCWSDSTTVRIFDSQERSEPGSRHTCGEKCLYN